MANYFFSPANRTKSVASFWPAELGQAVGFAVDRVDRRLGEAPGRRTARGGSTSWDRPTRGLLKNPQAACVAAKVVAPLGKAWTDAGRQGSSHLEAPRREGAVSGSKAAIQRRKLKSISPG